jgi:signal transduction histidine kinase
VLIVVISAVAAIRVSDTSAERGDIIAVLLIAIAASLAVSAALVHAALHPVRAVEETARRIWGGDLGARVPESPLADEDARRVAKTLNLLLEGLVSDRQRMRRLAREVIEAGDRERARIARELHDSTAQTLAALTMQVSALSRSGVDARCAEQLGYIRELAGSALEEVRSMSHSLHPRVLDDMGLPAALEALARTVRTHDAVDVHVASEGDANLLPVPVRSVLYRVAQEALGNAVRHARPATVNMSLTSKDSQATLQVSDDGVGFDIRSARDRRAGIGLHTMEERLALVDGKLTIESSPGHGTTVRAVVPISTIGDGDG